MTRLLLIILLLIALFGTFYIYSERFRSFVDEKWERYQFKREWEVLEKYEEQGIIIIKEKP